MKIFTKENLLVGNARQLAGRMNQFRVDKLSTS